MLLGLHDQATPIDFALVVRNEIDLHGCFAYGPDDFERSKRLLERGAVDVSAYVRRFAMADGQAAFERMAHSPGDTLKSYLVP
jgi:threonine dehydrogenase-like Zn-dependent dehydrogenase